MPDHTEPPPWDALAEDVRRDPLAAYDDMRGRCPVAHDARLGWTLFRHRDVMEVLHDPDTFGNVVSRHLSVPNGMDPPEHGAYRAIIDRYFAPDRMAAFEPVCRRLTRELIDTLARNAPLEVMGDLAEPFAVRMQCAFMGWPEALHGPLRTWMRRNHEATRSGDREATARVAAEFDATIRAQLAARREAGDAAPDDTTTRLLRERVRGRPLSDVELVSIIRNWTAGELATIAASLGIVLGHLAYAPALQRELREHPSRRPAAIDEILRIHGPLPANRRVARRPTMLAGHHVAAGERVTILWPSANRDQAVFGDPDAFDPDTNASSNLLYGAGIHACPGAPLARLELRVALEEAFTGTSFIEPVPGGTLEPASFPTGGYARVPLRFSAAAP